MTETQWLTTDDPYDAMHFAERNLSVRKWNLILYGFCRRIWPHLSDPVRELLLVFERYLEDPSGSTYAEVNRAFRPAEEHARTAEDVAVIQTAYDESGKYDEGIICQAAGHNSGLSGSEPGRFDRVEAGELILADDPAFRAELAAEADLIREVVGNPFRPVAFQPEWRTDATTGIALQMYDSHNFFAMPILADALQDAGCECPDILDHCRGPGPHVRGCWVVDLVLGRE